MKKTKCTGQTCVGDLRLSALDVGYDLRSADTTIALPAEFTSVGLDRDGETWLYEGTREELIGAIVAAKYPVDDAAH